MPWLPKPVTPVRPRSLAPFFVLLQGSAALLPGLFFNRTPFKHTGLFYGKSLESCKFGQQLPFGLCIDNAACRRRDLFYRPHQICAGALFCRRLEKSVRQLFAARQKQFQRLESVSGAGDRSSRAGGYRQHRRCFGSNSYRRPRRDILDVDHCIFRHGNDLRRSGSGANHPGSGSGWFFPRRAGVLYSKSIPQRIR